MTTIDPNPYSPYADADPTYRHVYAVPLSFGGTGLAPGILAVAACRRLAVVPDEPLRDTEDGPLPDGLCPTCLAVMDGHELAADADTDIVTPCRECGTRTAHNGHCALCRMEAHDAWWPTRTTTATPTTAGETDA